MSSSRSMLQDLRGRGVRIVTTGARLTRGSETTIAAVRSLVSAGTERSLVEFGQASLVAKARSQPEKVQQVLEKIRADGLLPTLEAVFQRLDEPLPLGYCNAGVVLEVGPGVSEFRPGDRVASNGAHAEIVCVPKNLCAKIPDEVSDEQAAFTVLASVGLQGVRLLQPTLGERFVVYGLGLIGLLSVQLLRANGCEVLGIDVNPKRLELAARFGATAVDGRDGQNVLAAASAWTRGRGVDGVLITASAKSDAIVHNSAQMCRKKGRIVLVGVVGLDLRRSDFYEKELSFQVSCSYGPGRYDERYEQGGQDYPLGYVRWTEQRNFEAVLEMLRTRRLVVDDLITHRVPFDDAPKAYEILTGDPEALGIILEYSGKAEPSPRIELPAAKEAAPAGAPRVGLIGAGNFAKMTLMPALSRTAARVAWVADLNGQAASYLGRKHGAERATIDHTDILKDPGVAAVLIAVRHDIHAKLVREALQAGKHVFVEKPLALTVEQVREIIEAAGARPDRHVTVGFNRRFSRHTVRVRDALRGRSEPLAMAMTVNAGAIPPGHWVHDPVAGGGRIVGEGCHFIDLMAHLAGSPVVTVGAAMLGGPSPVRDDKMSIVLGFADGSVGTLSYFANGSRSYPKEALEVFSQGRVFRIDNFRRTTAFGARGFRKVRTLRQDKGHRAQFEAWVERLQEGGPPLIPLEEIVNVTLASFAAVRAAEERRTIEIETEFGERPRGPAGAQGG